MPNKNNRILVDSIKRLMRRGATTNLRKIVNKTHAADLSIVFRYLPVIQQLQLLDMIKDTEKKGILFSELDEATFVALSNELELEDIVEVLEQMPSDDVADLIGRLPDEKSDAILEKMKKEGSEEIEGLLKYDDDTAGGIMVPDFIALSEETERRQRPFEEPAKGTPGCGDALLSLCRGRLRQVWSASVSLRQLVVVPAEYTAEADS